MEHVNFILNQIGKSYDQMANFQIMPGISLLGFCLALLLLHTLITVFLVNFDSGARAAKADRQLKRDIKASNDQRAWDKHKQDVARQVSKRRKGG